MLNHHIQKGIIYRLALNSPLRFSDLKPDEIENKLFNYHLKIVMQDGLVKKDLEGLYILTSKGKALGVHAYAGVSDIFRRSHSIILLAIKNDNNWLMYQRKNQPLKSMTGFMHCEPEAGVRIEVRASKYLEETCGIKAKFKIVGSGITTTYLNNEIESFVNFTVVLAEVNQTNFSADDPHASYHWVSSGQLDEVELLPNMNDILSGLLSHELFFIDKTYHLNID